MAMMNWKINRTSIGQDEIKIILCDDDFLFLENFSAEVSNIFGKLNMNVEIKSFTKIEDISIEQLCQCNMVFLDIDFENEDNNGIDIARKIREVNSKAVIYFVTNFIDYAPSGYEVQAFRYILKRDRSEVLERYIMQGIEKIAEDCEYLCLFSTDEEANISLKNIYYLEVLNHDVSIYTKEKIYTLHSTLQSFSEQLENYGFLRVHNSYLVNMRYIQKLRSRECLLIDNIVLPVSDRNYLQNKQKYLLWKGL